MRSNAVFAVTHTDRAAFFAEPSTTGDPRWDAMLAGSTEDLALRGGFPAPDWTPGHALPEFWFVGRAPSLHAYAFARSPYLPADSRRPCGPGRPEAAVNPGGGPLMGAEQIRTLLTELGARLDARGIEARLFLVGGAAMALAYSRDRVTRDLDAVFEPKREVYDEGARVANDFGLPENWLNDSVKGLLPDRSPPIEGTGSFAAAGIRVGGASSEYLFAM